jgi:hypothetical protein
MVPASTTSGGGGEEEGGGQGRGDMRWGSRRQSNQFQIRKVKYAYVDGKFDGGDWMWLLTWQDECGHLVKKCMSPHPSMLSNSRVCPEAISFGVVRRAIVVVGLPPDLRMRSLYKSHAAETVEGGRHS